MRKFLSVFLLALFLVACDGELPTKLATVEDARIPSVFLENGYAFTGDHPAEVIPVDHADTEEVAALVDELEKKDVDEIYFNLSKTDDVVTYLVLPRYAGLRFELYDDDDTVPVYSYETKPTECIFVTVDREDLEDHTLAVIDGDEKTVLALTANEIATSEEIGE